jgi:predicted NBD/HSP70 family sugar kinase
MNHIGIEIGGTKIQIVAGRAGDGFIERHRLAADRARGGAGIREQIASVVPGRSDDRTDLLFPSGARVA